VNCAARDPALSPWSRDLHPHRLAAV